jgi:hypothetical protein
MTGRLRVDPALAAAYALAHRSYLADRAQLGDDVPQIAEVSAGGMPTRVKCLHALVGHALAAGLGVNPLGDEALAAIGEFWAHPCLQDEPLPDQRQPHRQAPQQDQNRCNNDAVAGEAGGQEDSP